MTDHREDLSRKSGNGPDEGRIPPEFFSLDFHVRFFPSLLRRMFCLRREGVQSPFADHVPLEYFLALTLCLTAVVVGFPVVRLRGDFWGWFLLVPGMGGLIALIVGSVRSALGRSPTYNAFRPVIFLFFVVLGLTIGLVAGAIKQSPALQFWGGLGGLLAGYGLGIPAGLWVQVLGWIGKFLDVLALGGIAGMIVLDILMLL